MVSGFVSNLFLRSTPQLEEAHMTKWMLSTSSKRLLTVFTEVVPVNGDITPVLCEGRIAFSIDGAVVISGVAVVGQARQRFRFELLVDGLHLELQ